MVFSKTGLNQLNLSGQYMPSNKSAYPFQSVDTIC